MAVSDHRLAKDKKPNIFMRIGLFIRQVFDEMRKVVAPSGFDFGFGRLMFTLFG